MQSTSFPQYVGNTPQHQQMSAAVPQIYSAVYSGVEVYEMEVRGIAVMRRRADSWLNATQILKVAGVDKGKRTKVLEKEILIGEHEKVQGGYGKYQGTWIKFDRGVEFCRQYGVEELLRPILTYDMGEDGNVAGSGGVDTPTKEQAMAAQRKRLYTQNNHHERQSSSSGTFFKNISSTASSAVAAISKARMSPGPRSRMNGSRPASFSRQSSQQQMDGDFPMSQQSMQSFTSNNSYNMSHDNLNGGGAIDPAFNNNPTINQFGMTSNNEFEQPPRKRMRSSTNIPMSQQSEQYYDVSMQDGTPTEPNDSFSYPNKQNQGNGLNRPLPPLRNADSPSADEKRAHLMSLFQRPTQTDFSDHPAFTSMSSEDLDMPIDGTSHTALHWAATLARLPLVHALIQGGASIFRVNSGGETALMRACLVTNNLDNSCLPELLELLGPTIEMRDARGRTILHHIAVTSAVKGRSQASKYYLESLLEFVVRSGSSQTSQQSFHGNSASSDQPMGLVRFMAELVNAQDNSGDTALNIAVRIRNGSIVSQLLEVGADPNIPNRAGLKPLDFGDFGNFDHTGDGDTSTSHVQKAPKESSSDIISSITSLLKETERSFTAELSTKQKRVDNLRTQLRDVTTRLNDQRALLSISRAKAQARTELHLKIQTLRRIASEERQKLNALYTSHGIVPSPSIAPMKVGDADTSLSILPPSISPTSVLESPALLRSLPTASSLRSLVNTYAENNAMLERSILDLKGRSRDVEDKYRRLIGRCVGVEATRVDGLIESLMEAVESEGGDVELGRVKEFLGRVERDSGGGGR